MLHAHHRLSHLRTHGHRRLHAHLRLSHVGMFRFHHFLTRWRWWPVACLACQHKFICCCQCLVDFGSWAATLVVARLPRFFAYANFCPESLIKLSPLPACKVACTIARQWLLRDLYPYGVPFARFGHNTGCRELAKPSSHKR